MTDISSPDHLRAVLSHHFDHTSAGYSKHLRDWNAELRSCPIAHSDQHGGFWVLSRHADVVAALKDHRRFSSAAGIIIPDFGNPVPGIPTQSDEPLHAQYRKILWPFLTPAAVATYTPVVYECARRLIDAFADRGQVDIIEEFAKPLPAQVTGRFFGLSAEEGERCYRWIDTMITQSTGDLETMMSAATEFFSFLQESVDRAKAAPAEDVISAIVTAEVDGRPMTNEECVGMLFTSIAGALETTVSAIGHGVNLLGRNPEARACLVAEPGLIPAAVEEILRIDPPAYSPARTLLEDVEIGHTSMKAGERVLLLFGSANHDERQFENPHDMRIDRENNNHLAFGHGVHKCVGQHLARLELRVAIEGLLRRVPDYDLVGDPTARIRGGGTWGLRELSITWPTS